jgi:capsular exopolysaccharide synthesis family protein
MYSKPEAAPRVVLVSSPSANEGKTTVAINLAKILAQRGKTSLMEADLRRPSLAITFDLHPKIGLSQVLAGAGPLNEATANIADVPNLFVLTAGAAVSNPADLISSDKMQSLLISLRHDFDFVVVDSPPIIPLSGARILSGHADAVVLVGRYGLTTRRAITRCVQLLGEVRAPLVGVVLNDIDLESADYHYYNYG